MLANRRHRVTSVWISGTGVTSRFGGGGLVPLYGRPVVSRLNVRNTVEYERWDLLHPTDGSSCERVDYRPSFLGGGLLTIETGISMLPVRHWYKTLYNQRARLLSFAQIDFVQPKKTGNFAYPAKSVPR